MFETWIDGQTLAAIAYLIDLVIIGAVIAMIILLLVKEPEQDACYNCGKYFTPSLDTPMRTRSWDHSFCSERCKDDYRVSRV